LSVDDLRFASAAGALTTTRAGAIDSLPTRAEIDAFLRQQAG
jgi:sugar/nucleoside kinase (ribokinase family)